MAARTFRCGFVLVAALSMPSAPASAASHLWRFHELFSSPDGTIQFIEMKESLGACCETHLAGKWIRSDATGKQFIFPEDLDGITSKKHLLLATAAFAALPGAPAPDFIIEENFFGLEGDTLTYWTYGAATIEYGADELPLDGITALNPTDHTTSPNTPTNFDGETGMVDLRCDPADLDLSGSVDFADLLTILSTWGPCPDCPADLDGDGEVGFGDLLQLLAAWGPCE